MNALGIADRMTHDLDLFTPAVERIGEVADLTIDDLRRHGYPVSVDFESSGFIRLLVGDDSPTIVEFAHDYRWLEPVLVDVGLVLDPRELAADKLCALFGRAETRDVLDVGSLLGRFNLAEMADWAREKDRGFDLHITISMLRRMRPELEPFPHVDQPAFETLRAQLLDGLERLARLGDGGSGRHAGDLTVEGVGVEQWERVRALRLASLGEDPQSFFKLLSEEIGLTEEEWRARIGSVNTWVAVLDGVDVGVVTSSQDRDDPSAAHLLGLWVAPLGRRRGAAQSLSTAVIEHARVEDFRRVVLWVASANRGADALYSGLGFTRTGRTDTFIPPRDTYTEWELKLVP